MSFKLLKYYRMALAMALCSAMVSLGQNPEISCEDLHQQLGKIKIVDVRTPEEFTGAEGHIAGAELVTLGPDLTDFLQQGNPQEPLVFVCRSGRRSLEAVKESIQYGYQQTKSLKGGMLEWRAKGLPTQQEGP